MNGLEKIAEQIRAQAKAEADGMLANAKQEADGIRAQAQAEGEHEAQQLLAQTRQNADAELKRAQSAAEADGRRAILAEKQTQIAAVVDEARRRLTELPANEYFALMVKLAAENSLPESGELIFSAHDRARMPADFAQKLNEALAQKGGTLRISNDTRPIAGGFVLVYGGIEENCSINALFEAQREQLQDIVHRALFSGAELIG